MKKPTKTDDSVALIAALQELIGRQRGELELFQAIITEKNNRIQELENAFEDQKFFYVSFGQIHRHEIKGVVFDKDCLALIDGKNDSDAHDKAMRIFKGKFAFLYRIRPDMHFFPRGVIYVNQ